MRGSVVAGIGIGVALTALAFVLLYWVNSIPYASPGMSVVGFIGVLFIGGVQVLWMLPAAWMFRAKGQTRTVTGILIVAGVLFVLNAAVLGLFMTGALRLPGP